eukprot:995297-Prymnesium_polylepis.1
MRFKSPLLSDEIGRRTFRNTLINTRGERNTDQFSSYHHHHRFIARSRHPSSSLSSRADSAP